AAARVAGHAALRRRVLAAPLHVPVRGPLPDVARHVVEPEAVGREGADGLPAAGARLAAPGEVAVPVVGQPLPARLGGLAPDVRGALDAAAGRSLPLGLGRERPARPGRERLGVLQRDVDDRLVLAAVGPPPPPPPPQPARAPGPRPPPAPAAHARRPGGPPEG